MDLATIGPYAFPALVALITAVLTHRRSGRAHVDTVEVDRQRLLSETYDQLMHQLREAHREEREAWERLQATLKNEIRVMKEKVRKLEDELAQLRGLGPRWVTGGPS